mgnify:CR=1 FL=1
MIAVDSAPHVISPLTSASEKDRDLRRGAAIQSMGGGIFTYTALVTAATMVQESEQGHAAHRAVRRRGRRRGARRLPAAARDARRRSASPSSVIGLGSETDSDAAFLKDVAARGKGRIHFTAERRRSAAAVRAGSDHGRAIELHHRADAARTLPDMVLLGELAARRRFPSLDGYNLTYLRPGATMGVVTTDEYQAPVLAFWHRGLGRVASLTAEVGRAVFAAAERVERLSGFAVGARPLAARRRSAVGVQATSNARAARASSASISIRPRARRRRTRCARRRRRSCRRTRGQTADRSGSTLAWVGDGHAGSAVPAAESRDVSRRRATGHRHRAAARAAEPPPTRRSSSRGRSQGGPEDAERDRRASPAASSGRRGTTCSTRSRLRNRQVRDLVIPLTLMLLALHMAEIGGRRRVALRCRP